VQPSNRIEDRIDAAAQLTVVTIVETLEIDLVEIDPRPQVVQNALSAVAV